MLTVEATISERYHNYQQIIIKIVLIASCTRTGNPYTYGNRNRKLETIRHYKT